MALKPVPKRKKVARRPVKKQKVPQKASTGTFYWAGLVSLGILSFLCFFFLTEVILSIYNISMMFGQIPGELEPYFGRRAVTVLLIILVCLVATLVFHIRDSRRNLKISFVPTGALMSLFIMFMLTDVDDLIPLAFMLVALLAAALLDFYNILNYPKVLEKIGRKNLLSHLEREQKEEKIRTWMLEEEEKVMQKETELQGVKSDLAQKSQQLMEEEESLRTLQGEITGLRTEVQTQKESLMEEEENLRVKSEEITKMKIEMKQREEHIMEEEERVHSMEEEIISSKMAVEKRQEEIMEEEERIKVKEEAAAKLKVDFEIRSKLLEEMAQKKQMMEEEVLQMRSEIEVQVRKKLEEEEGLRLKKMAGRMGGSGSKVARSVFPFTAIVGQEKMKLALILNAINPEIGGVLIQGQKGTGKSIAIRGLAEILPNIEVVEGCRFNCDPKKPQDFCSDCRLRKEKGLLKTETASRRVVDLPLNTTEDRLVGSIDIEKVLSEGVRAFEPGLLAEAHRGILNVDEINLLDDYIVDILLDSAASGVVTVEREGVSISYPAQFVIVGSMNPEEGELRPQLLDRLALSAWVGTLQSVSERVEIVRRLEESTTDHKVFRERFGPQQEALRLRIQKARDLLRDIRMPKDFLMIIAKMCLEFNVEGHRADIIIQRAAAAHAAFQGRKEVTIEDLAIAAELALPHRMKKRSLGKEAALDTAVRKFLDEEMVA